MVRFKLGDLLDEKKGLICQQVNCRGKMRRGLAKQVSDQFPKVNKEYIDLCDKYLTCPSDLLGSVQFVRCSKGTVMCNLFAQDDYRFARSRQNTDYEAFQKCLDFLKRSLNYTNEPVKHRISIAFPWKIGSDLGGADFRIIFKMIVETLKDFDITFCYLETPEDLEDYMKTLNDLGVLYCRD